MRFICLLALTALVSLAGCQQGTDSEPAATPGSEPEASEGSKDFAPEGGGFSIRLPGTPGKETLSSPSPLGMIETSTFELQDEGGKLTYSIRYDDYPVQVLALLRGAANMLFARQKKLEGDLPATLISAENISLDEHPGKLLKYQVEDGSFAIYRVFMVEQRMYQLGVQAPEEEAFSQQISRFLDSFQLLERPEETDESADVQHQEETDDTEAE